MIDLGAGYGFFSYRVAKKASRVFSLEEDSHLFSCLANNVLDRDNVVPLKISPDIDWIKLFDYLEIDKVDFFRISSRIDALNIIRTIPTPILEKIETIVFESNNEQGCYSLNLEFWMKNHFYNLESGSLRLFNYLKKIKEYDL